ncbi:hypothetical protein [Candidatus Methanoperedens nitratireducens]|uniref:hypothetical protein n=1 Tax=Candidatus Methanoperedens nitratireducens TaxID=1392998 RepID=UPI00117844DC|nr:hypothetical protein [Candidatus Methanoperedens nitroreducens]
MLCSSIFADRIVACLRLKNTTFGCMLVRDHQGIRVLHINTSATDTVFEKWGVPARMLWHFYWIT